MFGTQDLALFIVAGIILNLTPGPDTIYIIGRSMSEGRKAGVMSVLGISSGIVVHTVLAAFGLSAVLVSSAVAFHVIKWVGAAYLIYLGIKSLMSKTELKMDIAEKSVSSFSIYQQGLITNVLNPKVALFFLAFLPQFISAENTSVVPFLFLGLVFVLTGTVWCLAVALFSATASNMIDRFGLAKVWINRLSGIAFIGMGLKMAFQGR